MTANQRIKLARRLRGSTSKVAHAAGKETDNPADLEAVIWLWYYMGHGSLADATKIARQVLAEVSEVGPEPATF